MTTTTATSAPRRRWFRFRLRTLLIVVTMLSLPLAWVGWELQKVRQERPVIASIEEQGGEVYFYSIFDEQSWWEKTKERCFGKRAMTVSLHDPEVIDLTSLVALENLKELYICSPKVKDLSPLAELKNLERLYLDYTQVTDEQVQRLQEALPNCVIEL
jgi:hypothetical protein